MNTCGYTKTVSGSCPQIVLTDSERCYYHTKVEAGLIETAEDEVLREMPTFKER